MDVRQAPCEATAAAASYLSREWGENRTLGFVGTHHEPDARWYVFQCMAGDGSRWLIASDRWGNTRDWSNAREEEKQLAAAFGVEVV